MPPQTLDPETAPGPAEAQLLATGKLFHVLAADPKYRKRVLGLIKEAAPETVIPELDLEQGVQASISAALKPHTDETAALKAQVATLQESVARRQWQERYGLTPDDLVEIEAMAKQKKIGDGETAIEFWRAQQALGTPRATRRPGEHDYAAELAKINPRNGRALREAAAKQAGRVLEELRGGRRAG